MSGAWTGLIMAGGQGERMALSGVVGRKPLVEVGGVSLLERNIWMMARGGCRHIFVALTRADAVREADRIVDFAARAAGIGVAVAPLIEEAPLGNFGAATMLSGDAADVLVVYADNLTTLDLAALATAHRASGAAMTLAAHEEQFRMPYGALEMDADDPNLLTAYREKPVYPILVGSGLAVVTAAALRSLPQGKPLGLVDAANWLVNDGEAVRLYRHQASWIDVNDAAKLAAAEALLQRDAAFEAWWPGEIVREIRVAGGNGGYVCDAMTEAGVLRVHVGPAGTFSGDELPDPVRRRLVARRRGA
ncbi:NTP transferase domain-containing protein [Mesorhizobium sp. CA18]|uniref:sugar phosphate nucleotidyltransferase n=1 Tax=unclassified Mesorhizobium TaxID=325217 RepID=UPI001CCFBC6C|nr:MULTISPECIES: sugar phosphate nucleotidyltransferase [unclassified Mesorhizobium]MBZ9737144.1 NTP transferase domain-containing protein [Mesorhizobium sp. CA9]MBZ9826584.1 NTP transferase domain-containing protein [Mesorhizobium sp. CA18]MBZ9830811.1 NTP transferase domain-containing protein [Mesorhizobium sp. CA2]MBZ9835513.1 NTP transferase domain-containing protein [Mesorhizobium sp. CA3]MBZ9875803.1 NTP transferase domain-containing protein [Mesorhizobium sp. Ca11]